MLARSLHGLNRRRVLLAEIQTDRRETSKQRDRHTRGSAPTHSISERVSQSVSEVVHAVLRPAVASPAVDNLKTTETQSRSSMHGSNSKSPRRLLFRFVLRFPRLMRRATCSFRSRDGGGFYFFAVGVSALLVMMVWNLKINGTQIPAVSSPPPQVPRVYICLVFVILLLSRSLPFFLRVQSSSAVRGPDWLPRCPRRLWTFFCFVT